MAKHVAANASPHPVVWFAGLDWGRAAHHFTLLDRAGRICLDRAVPHDAAGWQRLRRELTDRVGDDLSAVGVAVETRSGPAVEMLLQLGCTVFPIHPKAAQRYRDRKAPCGTKNDALDAWATADALRTDGHAWRPMRPPTPATQELQLLCRDEVRLIQQRTALINQLRQALHEYYPAALEAFDDWTAPSSWAFLKRFSTPRKLARAGRRRWQKFLHTQRLARPSTYARRMEIFARVLDWAAPQAVVQSKSLLAVGLAQRLQGLQGLINQYRKQINLCFDQHPDRDLFDSLPGAGQHLAPRLLSECCELPQRFDNAQGMQCYAGTAPVQFQSGKIHRVRVRKACNKYLRAAVHLWVHESCRQCAWADTYYRQKRKEGKTHACALRCLGQRWMKILWKMLQTRRPYNEALHTQNQIAHGSWILALQP